MRNQTAVFKFLNKIKPDAVIIAAAKVGGIYANNKYKADFIYDNLQIQNNLIHGSFKAGVNDLIFLGSSCIYPKNSKQPIKENYLLSNFLEKTNEPYAIAKMQELIMKVIILSIRQTINVYYPAMLMDQMTITMKNSHFFPALIKNYKFY